MDFDRLRPFRTLLATHRSARHPLFPALLEQVRSGLVDGCAYRVFAANLAARTMLTLPEIHASCVQAALDLDPVRTAFGVMTSAEEGGFGRPDQVHTNLMMDALNNHGRIVFGLPPLDLTRLMAAARLAHAAGQVSVVFQATGPWDPDRDRRLRGSGVFDVAGSLALCRSLVQRCGLRAELPNDPGVGAMESLRSEAIGVLYDNGVIVETVEYCLAQLALPAVQRPGYLQGVGFAHEGLADGMIFSIFKIAYADRHRYAGEDDFLSLAYPYFAAHGDYLAMVRGDAGVRDGVEAVHAQREYAKLEQLDDESLAAALDGAKDFADRNVRIWDGLERELGGSPGPAQRAVVEARAAV